MRHVPGNPFSTHGSCQMWKLVRKEAEWNRCSGKETGGIRCHWVPGSCCICSETYQALLSPSSPLLLKPGKHEFQLLATHGILMGQNRSGKFLGFKMLCAWYNCFSALLAPLPMPNHELPMDGVITLLDGNQVTSCV